MSQIQRDPIVNNPKGIKPGYFGQFINNFTNWWNDHDSGVRTWNNVNVNTLVVNTKATVPNGSTSTDAAAFGQIKLLQTVTATTTGNTTTTSSTYQTTGLTASITPTLASNRVLIFVSGVLVSDTQGNVAFLTIKRGSTDLGTASGMAQAFSSAGGQINCNVGINFVDSPASVSSQTYTVYFKSQDNVHTVEFGNGATASITLMEVA